MVFLPFVPLITVLTSIYMLATESKCANLVQDCEYDDSSDSFHAYAKKS